MGLDNDRTAEHLKVDKDQSLATRLSSCPGRTSPSSFAREGGFFFSCLLSHQQQSKCSCKFPSVAIPSLWDPVMGHSLASCSDCRYRTRINWVAVLDLQVEVNLASRRIASCMHAGGKCERSLFFMNPCLSDCLRDLPVCLLGCQWCVSGCCVAVGR